LQQRPSGPAANKIIIVQAGGDGQILPTDAVSVRTFSGNDPSNQLPTAKAILPPRPKRDEQRQAEHNLRPWPTRIFLRTNPLPDRPKRPKAGRTNRWSAAMAPSSESSSSKPPRPATIVYAKAAIRTERCTRRGWDHDLLLPIRWLRQHWLCFLDFKLRCYRQMPHVR
jgi:hypothetical protein